MGQRKSGAPVVRGADQAMRDEEVLRANRELAAYFKGRRTEREARAALKIIKAFVRDRERQDARSRPPLPGTDVARPPKEVRNGKAASDKGERHPRKSRRKPQNKSSRRATASTEPQVNAEPPQLSESH